MKRLLIFLSFLLILNCSLLKKPEPIPDTRIKKSLISQTKTFREFKASGIINFQFKNLELKSNFVLFKQDDKLRLDVIQGGIFGLSPTPRAQICNNEKFQIFLPEKNLVYKTNSIKFMPELWQDKINQAKIESGNDGGYSVILTKTFKLKLYKNLNIQKIYNEQLIIYLSKYKNGLPGKIEVLEKDNLLVELIIEKWIFEDVKNSLFRLKYSDNIKTEELSTKALLRGEILNGK